MTKVVNQPISKELTRSILGYAPTMYTVLQARWVLSCANPEELKTTKFQLYKQDVIAAIGVIYKHVLLL